MEGLPWPQITAAAGGWLLLGFFVLAVLRGALVPRSTLDDAIHDRDEWRAESRIKDAQITEKDKQLGELSEVAGTVQAVMTAIQTNASHGGHA